jgi:hypothetical protein
MARDGFDCTVQQLFCGAADAIAPQSVGGQQAIAASARVAATQKATELTAQSSRSTATITARGTHLHALKQLLSTKQGYHARPRCLVTVITGLLRAS